MTRPEAPKSGTHLLIETNDEPLQGADRAFAARWHPLEKPRFDFVGAHHSGVSQNQPNEGDNHRIMDPKIFDVEHGACALLTCDNGTRIMIDCGHNGNIGWYPGMYLREEYVSQTAMLTVSNYGEDHVSCIENLFSTMTVASLTRNPSASAATIRQLKSEDGMGRGSLTHYIDKLFTGASTFATVYHQGLERQHFWNPYPQFDDENNLVTFFHCHRRAFS